MGDTTKKSTGGASGGASDRFSAFLDGHNIDFGETVISDPLAACNASTSLLLSQTREEYERNMSYRITTGCKIR